MHTRSSNKQSPLAFDPEIEQTLRRNRVLLRENKISGSPSTSTTPIHIMDQSPPPPPTTGQIPFTPPPNPSKPTSTAEIKPPNTTLPQICQTEGTFSFGPSFSGVPPFSSFFPSSGQSSSSTSQPRPPAGLFHIDPPIVHATSSIPPNVQYQTVGGGGDMYNDGYDDDFEGYDEEGYVYASDGNQGDYVYVQGQNQSQAGQGFGGPQQQQPVIQYSAPQ
jgi:hypothetical protein